MNGQHIHTTSSGSEDSTLIRKGSGFEDDPEWPSFGVCRDKSHNPPGMLVIPPGKRYRHVCPSCGQTTYIRSAQYTC